jgi:hypothetical protein
MELYDMQLWERTDFVYRQLLCLLFFLFSLKLSDCILQSLNDGTPDVRDSAFSVLAAVAKVAFPFEKNIEKFLLQI